MEHDPWVTLFLPHSLLRTRGVRALPTVDRAPFYNCNSTKLAFLVILLYYFKYELFQDLVFMKLYINM